jgi:hypothetical protein
VRASPSTMYRYTLSAHSRSIAVRASTVCVPTCGRSWSGRKGVCWVKERSDIIPSVRMPLGNWHSTRSTTAPHHNVRVLQQSRTHMRLSLKHVKSSTCRKRMVNAQITRITAEPTHPRRGRQLAVNLNIARVTRGTARCERDNGVRDKETIQ